METWCSLEWKSDELMDDRTGRLVVTAQHTDRFIVENDKMSSYTEAESEMSIESRSFLNRVNDQVRKRQNQSSKDATKDSDKNSVWWRIFVSSTLQASVFMGKNYSDNLHSMKNTEDLTMKQMFDISEKFVTEQSDEIYGMSAINWEHSSWKHLPLVGGEQVISLLHTKVYVFWDSVLCLGKVNENPKSNIAWRDRLKWFKSSPEYRALDRIDGEPMEFEWNIFPGFTTLQLCTKVQELMSKMSATPEKFTGRIIFMSMFSGISSGSKENQQECESSAQPRFSPCKETWSRTMVIPRTWIRKEVVLYQGRQSTRTMGQNCRANDVDTCRKHTPSIPIHESIIQRSAPKAKVVENCQYTIAPTRERLKLFFAQLF